MIIIDLIILFTLYLLRNRFAQETVCSHILLLVLVLLSHTLPETSKSVGIIWLLAN